MKFNSRKIHLFTEVTAESTLLASSTAATSETTEGLTGKPSNITEATEEQPTTESNEAPNVITEISTTETQSLAGYVCFLLKDTKNVFK